jgi:Fe-S-cluster containining protein
MSEKPWYHNGLNFKCTGCGQCCTGSPGYVWVNEKEIEAIANHLNISKDEFMKTHVRHVDGKYSLKEKSKYDCIFLKDNRCTIYSVRPTQCKTFPWWPANLQSPERWQGAAKSCEGITPDAPLVHFPEIDENRQKYENKDMV